MLTDTEPTFALVGAPYLEYLPVVDLSSGRLLGMEALVRWQHPTQGRIPPDQLIPEAETSGDIGPLTRWVLMEGCEQARRWSPSIQLGVNCTIHQLRRGEVSKAVARALEDTGFRSGQLTLEVTEDAIVDSAASADLKALSDMGVQLSVDDVGTNWSSFEPFKRHSISTVKIDGSFIAGLEPAQGINRLVVETVIHMAHSLGMSAIVESVETAAQVDIVRSFNADAAQGFFFARPMSSEDAVAFATGPELPQFSCKEIRTLVSPRSGPEGGISLDGFGSETVGVDSDSMGDASVEDAPVDAVVDTERAGPPDQEAAGTGAERPGAESDHDDVDLFEADTADAGSADAGSRPTPPDPTAPSPLPRGGLTS